jgi:hypothetical protein
MKQLNHEALAELVEWQVGPCVSIYMNISRGPNPHKENGVLLRDYCDKATEELRQTFGKHDAQEFLQPIRHIADHDSDFWLQKMKAAAFFRGPDYFKVIPLLRETGNHLAVADNFHIKPLVRATQFSGRFQVLSLTQHRVAMYEGTQDDFKEIDRKGVPANIVEALKVYNDRILTVNATPGSVDKSGGHKDADDDSDTFRFFRVVDRAVWENHSRESGLPLILCALDEYQTDFHRISRNPNLLDEGIRLHPDAATMNLMHADAWKIIEPQYRRQVEQMADNFKAAKAHQHGSDDLREIGLAVAESRVSVLLVDDSKSIGGKVDLSTGTVQLAPVKQPDVDDVFDDLAEAVMKTGGQVFVLPPDQMPTDTGVAAIYRY